MYFFTQSAILPGGFAFCAHAFNHLGYYSTRLNKFTKFTYPVRVALRVDFTAHVKRPYLTWWDSKKATTTKSCRSRESPFTGF